MSRIVVRKLKNVNTKIKKIGFASFFKVNSTLPWNLILKTGNYFEKHFPWTLL